MTFLFWFWCAVTLAGLAVVIACLLGYWLTLRQRDAPKVPDSDMYEGGPGDPVEYSEDPRGAQWSAATLAQLRSAKLRPLVLNSLPRRAA